MRHHKCDVCDGSETGAVPIGSPGLYEIEHPEHGGVLRLTHIAVQGQASGRAWLKWIGFAGVFYLLIRLKGRAK